MNVFFLGHGHLLPIVFLNCTLIQAVCDINQLVIQVAQFHRFLRWLRAFALN